jgi:hypothetical protein
VSDEAQYKVGDSFNVHFAWKLPDGDFLRAVFKAEVLGIDPLVQKYVLRLAEFVAGRQETEDGEARPLADYDREYWGKVDTIAGKRISLAFEADDGRPLWLRLATLTGEHNFFDRLN